MIISLCIKKSLKWTILTLILVLVMSISPVFADDLDLPVDNDEFEAQTDDDLKQTLRDLNETLGGLKVTPSVDDPIQEVHIETLRISSAETSGLHSIMLGLIGDYNPIVKDYTYQSQQGYTQHSIEIEPDYSWIAAAAIFLVVLFCFFRLLGSLLGGNR